MAAKMNKPEWRYTKEDGLPKPLKVVLAQDAKDKTAVVVMGKNKRFRYAFQCDCSKELDQRECWRWMYIEELE